MHSFYFLRLSAFKRTNFYVNRTSIAEVMAEKVKSLGVFFGQKNVIFIFLSSVILACPVYQLKLVFFLIP